MGGGSSYIWGINQQGSNNTASSSSLGDDNNSGTGQYGDGNIAKSSWRS
jgi:hypothetical protein